MTLESELQKSTIDGYLPCAVAFSLARRLKTTPRDVGEAANRLKVRITNCQLGCFVIKKSVHEATGGGEDVNEAVVEGIRCVLDEGRLPCATAFEIGREMRVGLKEIGDAANRIGVKVSRCQLGCFP